METRTQISGATPSAAASRSALPLSASLAFSTRNARRLPRRRGPLPVQARRQQEEQNEDEEVPKQGLLGNLFGTGTQRIKLGDAEKDSASKGTQRLKLPSGGTQRLQKGSTPAGFLQRLGSVKIAQKDPNTVFVAGATGRLGLRIVRELLLAGFKVRAGARNPAKAQEYADLAGDLGILPADAVKRLQIVTVDLEDEETIGAAIGNAGKVVQAIGAAESNVLDFGAPKRVDGDASINLVNAAVAAGAQQFVMVTSLGTGKFGWPASALNLFGGILLQKRRAEQALEESGLAYVIVRPGGMERPTDDHGRTHNVRLATRDQLFGGTVSRLQVAELVAAAVANPELAENKVLEVVAETEAPQLDYEELLELHPSEVSQADRARQRELEEEAQARFDAAQEELETAAEARSEAARMVAELQEALRAKQAAIREAEQTVAPVLKEAQRMEAELERVRQETELNRRREEAAKAVMAAARNAQRNGQVLSAEEIKAIEEQILNPQAAEEEEEAAAPPAAKAAPKKQAPWAMLNRRQESQSSVGVEEKPTAVEEPEAEEKPDAALPTKSRRTRNLSDPSSRRAQQLQRLASATSAMRNGAVAPSKQEAPAPTAAKGTPVKEPEPTVEEAEKKPAVAAPKKPSQQEEEVESLRQRRAKTAEAQARREAQFLAQLDAARKEEEAKKRQEAEKRAEAARKQMLEARRALIAKQEEAAAKAAEEEEKKKAATAKAAQAVKDKTAAATSLVEKKAAPGEDEAAQQAKRNAQEARAWIDAWRNGQATDPVAVPSSEDAEEEGQATAVAAEKPAVPSSEDAQLQAKQNAEEARAWIAAWREGQTATTTSGGAEQEGGPSNVAEAREWIRDWRARTLEAKLPEESRIK